MAEAPTFWLVTYSHDYDGWNGREWSVENAEDVAERGFFLSKEEAQGYIEEEKKRLLDEARAKDEAEVAHKNVEAEKRYLLKVQEEATRRDEYDVLTEAGLTPSFQRPPERDPFKPTVSKFDEDVFLHGLARTQEWEIVEIQSHYVHEGSAS